MTFVRVRFRISRMCAQQFFPRVSRAIILLQFDRRQVVRLIVIVLITIFFYAIVIINIIRYERITRGVDLRGPRFS